MAFRSCNGLGGASRRQQMAFMQAADSRWHFCTAGRAPAGAAPGFVDITVFCSLMQGHSRRGSPRRGAAAGVAAHYSIRPIFFSTPVTRLPQTICHAQQVRGGGDGRCCGRRCTTRCLCSTLSRRWQAAPGTSQHRCIFCLRFWRIQYWFIRAAPRVLPALSYVIQSVLDDIRPCQACMVGSKMYCF